MELISLQCPHCGAVLRIEPDQKQVVCEYCGSPLLIDNGASQAQTADDTQGGRVEVTRPVQSAPPKKRRTWLWVIGWILIFPVPLTILMARNKDLDLWLRIAIIAAAWIVFFVIGSTGGERKQNTTDETVFVTVAEADETQTTETTLFIPQSKAEL